MHFLLLVYLGCMIDSVGIPASTAMRLIACAGLVARSVIAFRGSAIRTITVAAQASIAV